MRGLKEKGVRSLNFLRNYCNIAPFVFLLLISYFPKGERNINFWRNFWKGERFIIWCRVIFLVLNKGKIIWNKEQGIKNNKLFTPV